MPKSKRAKTFHLTQVNKKTREEKEALFQNIKDTVPKFEHCFVLGFDNIRNNHLKDVRREMSDSRYVNTIRPIISVLPVIWAGHAHTDPDFPHSLHNIPP